MSASEVLFRAHDYPETSHSKTTARTRQRPHRTQRRTPGRKPANDSASGVCPYSPSCFNCPLPDCRQPASACIGVNNLNG